MPTAEKKKGKKKAEQATVHLGFVIDESGSMGPNQQSVTAGYNEFISTLKEEENAPNVRATCGFFDDPGFGKLGQDKVRFLYEGLPLPKVDVLGNDVYRPRGGTPLNDATATVIHRVADEVKEGDRVMIVVMTDGHENASTEYDKPKIQALVRDKEAAGWEFIYMGANVDAFANSQALGMSGKQGSYMNFTSSPVGTSNAMKTNARRAGTYTSSAAAYGQTLSATPDTIAEDPAEFAKQEEAMLKAREEAEAKVREESQGAISKVRDAMRGGE